MTHTLIFICNQYGPGSGALKRLSYIQDRYKSIRVVAVATASHKKEDSFIKSYRLTKNIVSNLFWEGRYSHSKCIKFLTTEIKNSTNAVFMAQHKSGLIIIIFLSIIRALSFGRLSHCSLNVVEVGSYHEKKFVHKLLSSIAQLSADRIICISETILSTIPPRVRKKSNFEVVYNGFDIAKWKSLVSEPPSKQINKSELLGNTSYCLITRNHPVKRNELIFEQFCTEQSIKRLLFVAGEFSDTDCSYWDQRSNGRIIFLGFLQAPQIKYLMENVDIYISYSRSEGMSDALLQAAALSKTLILSKIPSFLEFANKASTAQSDIHLIDDTTKIWDITRDNTKLPKYNLSWCSPAKMASRYLKIE